MMMMMMMAGMLARKKIRFTPLDYGIFYNFSFENNHFYSIDLSTAQWSRKREKKTENGYTISSIQFTIRLYDMKLQLRINFVGARVSRRRFLVVCLKILLNLFI